MAVRKRRAEWDGLQRGTLQAGTPIRKGFSSARIRDFSRVVGWNTERGTFTMRRDLPQLLRTLRVFLDECRFEDAKLLVRKLEGMHWGRKKKKKHKAVEGAHGDGI